MGAYGRRPLDAVHPRVCGERNAAPTEAEQKSGSSPRVWGTREQGETALFADRFIPACVGNACGACAGKRGNPVHPRVCGERRPGTARAHAVRGSSPRVWGTRRCGRTASAERTVHPRVCGERAMAHSRIAGLIGSSPRVWGTRGRQVRRLRRARFIPACVGNAGRRPAPSRGNPVHPRVCGERLDGGQRPQRRRGSSPRVWGTPEPVVAAYAVFRFIPACVGNALIRCAVAANEPVHPRVCGEHASTSTAKTWAYGSSPRVWGTLPVTR